MRSLEMQGITHQKVDDCQSKPYAGNSNRHKSLWPLRLRDSRFNNPRRQVPIWQDLLQPIAKLSVEMAWMRRRPPGKCIVPETKATVFYLPW